MKFLTNSNDSPKRLFVPINEFEFNSFAVRVRRLASRHSKAPQGVFRINQRHGVCSMEFRLQAVWRT
jgi:hypothetical protein